jgi:uncharacterized membrane protein YidH (DUF202 family)
VTAGSGDPADRVPDDPADRVPDDPGHPIPDDIEDLDPGLAWQRTSLAWTRTALSFAAVGGVVLKKDVVPGLVILGLVPVVWQLGRLPRHLRGRLQLVTATIVTVSLVALIVALVR